MSPATRTRTAGSVTDVIDLYRTDPIAAREYVVSLREYADRRMAQAHGLLAQAIATQEQYDKLAADRGQQ